MHWWRRPGAIAILVPDAASAARSLWLLVIAGKRWKGGRNIAGDAACMSPQFLVLRHLSRGPYRAHPIYMHWHLGLASIGKVDMKDRQTDWPAMTELPGPRSVIGRSFSRRQSGRDGSSMEWYGCHASSRGAARSSKGTPVPHERRKRSLFGIWFSSAGGPDHP